MNLPISESQQQQLLEGAIAVERIEETLELLQLTVEQLQQGQAHRSLLLLETSIARLENDADILKVLLQKLIE